MYVRWKRRERVSRRGGRVRKTGRVLLVAAPVTCERRDGRPRQRTLAYPGPIPAERVGYVRRRQALWEAAGQCPPRTRPAGQKELPQPGVVSRALKSRGRVRRLAAEPPQASDAERTQSTQRQDDRRWLGDGGGRGRTVSREQRLRDLIGR
jgi:hypothetical protein